jgi:hypothetical protein
VQALERVLCISLCQTTSLTCLVYVSLSKYLLALAGHVLAFDAGGIGDAGENKKVNASMDLLGKSKDLLLDIFDNPFGSSPSISFDSDISILASSRCISID